MAQAGSTNGGRFRGAVRIVHICLSVIAGLVAGVLVAVPGMRSIYSRHTDYVDYQQWLAWHNAGGKIDYQDYSYAGGMVIVAIPLIVLGWSLQRLFLGRSWRVVRRKDIPRSTLRRYRLVFAVAALALEVPTFWLLVPGIVGEGRARGYEWSAAVGCLVGALLVALCVGCLALFVLVELSTRRSS
ncbi:hypothetical protein C7C46_18015 [Streptomyces tateyamensis]|uniref:DUF2975 domain-containing protein n=1 Tax=Streptomyces tateyamensis TaxID=565073 RepID=A0A2V4N4G6_9ACTN|nr:hypothetical protein [Streptomyces tateyamensis]PYC77749.1 hypothetical protein C7C46_18015 [Streptomyces tateyamensis]